MKEFGKMVLAVAVGTYLYEVVNGVCEELWYRRKKRRQEQQDKEIPPQKDQKRSTYSSEISGRRTIGFKMQGEE